MGRKTMIIVSDEADFIASARAFCETKGGTCKVFSTSDWSRQVSQPGFVHGLTGEKPVMVGQSQGGAKILPFPGMPSVSNEGHAPQVANVRTIDELESEAIKKAINSFNGNLTEAAKALGIGRATLYRKVKQYNIDPAEARRRKMAA